VDGRFDADLSDSTEGCGFTVSINDERASGLALGLAAHAIGTAQAWQRGSVAGRYAAFGMAVNAVFTAIWLPTFILYLQKM